LTFAVALPIGTLLAVVPTQVAQAATDTVTNCSDSSTPSVGSLRYEVDNASSGDTIDFDLPSSCDGVITLTDGYVYISSDLTIDGPGASSLAVSGDNAGGVFYVESGATTTVSGLTVEDATPPVDYHGAIDNVFGGTLTVSDDIFSDNNDSGIVSTGAVSVNGSTFSDNSATAGISTQQGGAIDQESGSLTISGSTFSGNSAYPGWGGAISNASSSLTVTDSTFSGNSATYTWGGGAIYSDPGTPGSVTISGSTFSDNSTGGLGGAISSYGSSLTISGSTFSGNSSIQGGAIDYSGDTLALTGSTVSNNTAQASCLTCGGIGGGIAFDGTPSSTLSVTDSTISGNTALGADGSYGVGGGIFSGSILTVTESTISGNSAGNGGGIDFGSADSTGTITDSTVSDNTATIGGVSSGGGGILNASSSALTLTHVTVSGNTAPAGYGGGISTFDATTTLVATIVANNGSGLDCASTDDLFTTPTDGGYNLDDDGSCGLSGANNSLSDTPAGLDPSGLADNGGPTKTIALESGSAAIDHVTSAADCTGNDQRGVPWSTPCDIGAVGYVLTPTPLPYTPVTPTRICDTRATGPGVAANQCNDEGAGTGTLGPAGTLTMTVPSLPAGATAFVLNITVTNTTAPSFLTAWPTGSTRPNASNLNWIAGETVPNLVEVTLGSSDEVSFYNRFGSTDVVVDLEGYVAPASAGTGLFNPLPPSRICDTRAEGPNVPANQCNGDGTHAGTLGPEGILTVQVTGEGGVPSSGVAAVVLNVTVTNTTAPSFLTAWPKGATQPLASNLNWVTGKTVPNRVIVPVGTGGQVSIYNRFGSTDVIVDVGGWFTDSSNPSATGTSYVALSPTRICDTRAEGPNVAANQCNGNGTHAGTLGPGGEIPVQVTGLVGIPSGATAVVANVTVTDTTAPSFLTVWPEGTARPNASDLNWVLGVTVPNLVVVELGSDGGVDAYNSAGSTDVLMDAEGYYISG
jgi:predicted outer membrane repeat protein